MRLSGRNLVLMGVMMTAALFVLYWRYQNPELILPGAVDGLVRIGIGFYAVLFLSLGTIAYGLYRYGLQKESEGPGVISVISRIVKMRRPKRVFVATFVMYGVFFSLTSGTLVYQPELTFSYHYGVEVPSVEISPCCDHPGYRPLILAYLTEHVGLQIFPLNLALQAAVSYLVGLNAAIAVGAISLSKKRRSASSIGAICGLFIACPTCVGSFMSLFVGVASGIALSVAISHLQTAFIAISIPVLVATPFILVRRISNPDGTCVI